jgi:hypothetical protein
MIFPSDMNKLKEELATSSYRLFTYFIARVPVMIPLDFVMTPPSGPGALDPVSGV